MIEIFKCQSELFDKHANISKNIEKVYFYEKISDTLEKSIKLDHIEWRKTVIKDPGSKTSIGRAKAKTDRRTTASRSRTSCSTSRNVAYTS